MSLPAYERQGECLGCGINCCTLAAIPINLREGRHQDYLGWLSAHDNLEIKEVGGYQFVSFRARCQYLTEDQKCSVFGKPERPELCSRWPQEPWELELMDAKGQQECGYSFVAVEAAGG